jgi:hypothetical protein
VSSCQLASPRPVALQHLPGALDADSVQWVDPDGGGGIKLGQKGSAAFGGHAGIGQGADSGRGVGNLGQPPGQGGEVQPGAADDHHRAGQKRGQIAQPMADGIGLVGQDMAIQRMGQGGLVRQEGRAVRMRQLA